MAAGQRRGGERRTRHKEAMARRRRRGAVQGAGRATSEKRWQSGPARTGSVPERVSLNRVDYETGLPKSGRFRSGSDRTGQFPKRACPARGRAATGRVRVIKVILSAPRPPARADPGHGPAHPSCRTKWGALERGAGGAGRQLHPPGRNRRDAESMRSGPARLAERSITKGVWVCAKLKRYCNRDNSATSHARPLLQAQCFGHSV